MGLRYPPLYRLIYPILGELRKVIRSRYCSFTITTAEIMPWAKDSQKGSLSYTLYQQLPASEGSVKICLVVLEISWNRQTDGQTEKN